ncbi:MAG: hypothetical protein QOH17_4493 [Pseudonocardiales bacterium]|nr:hypothetical protein [Pseudonocardiales bacterium]
MAANSSKPNPSRRCCRYRPRTAAPTGSSRRSATNSGSAPRRPTTGAIAQDQRLHGALIRPQHRCRAEGGVHRIKVELVAAALWRPRGAPTTLSRARVAASPAHCRAISRTSRRRALRHAAATMSRRLTPPAHRQESGPDLEWSGGPHAASSRRPPTRPCQSPRATSSLPTCTAHVLDTDGRPRQRTVGTCPEEGMQWRGGDAVDGRVQAAWRARSRPSRMTSSPNTNSSP